MSDPGFLADVMENGPSEVKKLLARLAFYTHTAYRRTVGNVHAGRLYGHKDYRGKTHAVNGSANIYSGEGYRALCGEFIAADHDGYGFNVHPATDENGAGVTCKRCRAAIKKNKR